MRHEKIVSKSDPISLKMAIEAFDDGKVLTHPLFDEGEYFFRDGGLAIISSENGEENISKDIFWSNRQYNSKEKLFRIPWQAGYQIVELESNAELLNTPKMVFDSASLQLFSIHDKAEAVEKMDQGFMVAHPMLLDGGYILKGVSGKFSVFDMSKAITMFDTELKRFLDKPYFNSGFLIVKRLDPELSLESLRNILRIYHEPDVKDIKPVEIIVAVARTQELIEPTESKEEAIERMGNFIEDKELFAKAQEIIKTVYLMGYLAFYDSIEDEADLDIIHKSIHSDSIKFIDLLLLSLKNLAIEDPAMRSEIEFLEMVKKTILEMNTYTSLMLFLI